MVRRERSAQAALRAHSHDSYARRSDLKARVYPYRELSGVVLDLDATDDPLHGNQEGRFFHGYYGHYCYLPLYITCGQHVLRCRLRRADGDASDGAVEELQAVVAQIRQRWPETKILARGDSGFCREPIMVWCEGNGVHYVLGLARNARL